MAKSARQLKGLKALIDRADALARTATREWKKAVLEIRKEIVFLSRELDVGGSARARDKVIAKVQLHINRLNKRLDRLIENQLLAASKEAHAEGLRQVKADASVVRYDPKRAEAILKWVNSRNGGDMAAVFTGGMSRNAVTQLRNAVVGAFQEQAISGGSLRDLTNMIRDRWETLAGKEATLRFIDRSGRMWDTNAYLTMNVRTNTMKVYNAQIVDTFSRATGSDIVRISDDGHTEKHSCEPCKKWAGRMVSVSGATEGFPTLEEAEADGLFHPNCIHTVEPVNEKYQADEIEEERKRYEEEGW